MLTPALSRSQRLTLLCCAVALWTPLLYFLSQSWIAFESYSYGWAVPALCAYLLWQRYHDQPEEHEPRRSPQVAPSRRDAETALPPAPCPLLRSQWSVVRSLLPSPSPIVPSSHRPSSVVRSLSHSLSLPFLAAIVLLLLFLPVRLLHGANPLWRLTALAWALILVCVTLLMIWSVAGSRCLKRFAPAIAFLLAGVPWPSQLEFGVTNPLLRANTAITADLLLFLNVPALQNGNVLQLATGNVGVEDACSGIRSLQVTLMLALFFGLVNRLPPRRFLALLALAPLIAFGFNVVRTTLLSLVAARHGPPALERWHDPAGVLILVACFLVLWLLARKFAAPARSQWSVVPSPFPSPSPIVPSSHSPASSAPCSLPPAPCSPEVRSQWSLARSLLPWPLFAAVWLLLSELGTEAWFRTRERALPPATTWSLTLPTASPEFRHSTLPRRTLQSLRCDTAHRCSWTDSSGYDWLLLYVRWLPGNNAAQFSQLHSPDACLPAAGWMLHPLPGLRPLGPLQPPLPFLSYRIQDLNGRSGYLFFCRTTDRRDDESQAPGLTRSQRVHRMFQGRTNQGATVLELAVFGPPDDAAAQRCVAATLANALIPH